MTEFKAKIISVEYHKPEYHITIEVYIDDVLNSETMITAQDTLTFLEIRALVLDQLHAIKDALELGAELNSHIGQEIILT